MEVDQPLSRDNLKKMPTSDYFPMVMAMVHCHNCQRKIKLYTHIGSLIRSFASRLKLSY